MTARKFIKKLIGDDLHYYVLLEAGGDTEEAGGDIESIAVSLRYAFEGMRLAPPFYTEHEYIDVDRLEILDFVEDRTRGQRARAVLLLAEVREAVADVWGGRMRIYDEWVAAGRLDDMTNSRGQRDYSAIHKALFGECHDRYLSFLLETLEAAAECEDTAELEASPRGRRSPPFTENLLVSGEYREAVLSTFHTLIRGRKGRAVALVILAGMRAHIITRPTYTAIRAEFGDIGDKAGFNRYMRTPQAFDAAEVESVISVLQACKAFAF
ncbi:MAG: hypothetical protein NC116_09040 [Clostridium sp.]|nr:hypothetical protein [Bacteroidales bacterium]MCM1510845.1 hypothetical protein [Clostridium sp.]